MPFVLNAFFVQFEDLYTDLIKEAPEDPIQFIFEWGAKKKNISVARDDRNYHNLFFLIS